MNRILRWFRWLNRLTDRQVITLGIVLGSVAALASGLGVVTLVNRFGWRALPLLVVVMVAAGGGIVAGLSMLRDLKK